MKVLVTGGAGYIGSTTAAHLLDAGHQVVIIDNLSRGHREAVPASAVFFDTHIADREKLQTIFNDHKFDAVLHFAGFIEAGESMEKPELYFQNNLHDAKVFLDEVKRSGTKHFIFSSSAAVYKSKNNLLNEDDETGPTNIYGQTKLDFENILNQSGLKVCSIRYFNASGACSHFDNMFGEQHNPESHLIPRVLDVAHGKSHKIFIFGDDYETHDGTNVRDYIHVDDLVDAHITILEHMLSGKPVEKAYNAGTGRGYSVKEIIEAARKVTGHPVPSEIVERRPGDSHTLVANSDRLKQLGWRPKHETIHSIIASAWEWHKNHLHRHKH